MNTSLPYTPADTPASRPPRDIRRLDRIVSLCIYLLAFLFLYSGMQNATIIVWLSIAALLVLTPCYLRRHQIYFSRSAVLMYTILPLFSLPMILSDTPLVRFLSIGFVIFGYLYLVHFLCAGYGFSRLPGEALLLDGCKAVFVMPFSQFGAAPEAMFGGKKNGIGKKIGWILLGLLLAVIPTFIVTLLLCGADSRFEALLSGIKWDISDRLPQILVCLFWGLPLCFYVFGHLWACGTHSCGGGVSEEVRKRTNWAVRFAPSTLTCAAVFPLLAVYMLFFFVQLKSYLGGFTGSLPDGMTYSGYAREGFFELCTVSFINMLALGALFLFTRREREDHLPLAPRIVSVVLSCFTLILLSTACAKMLLYVSAYGLSRKRIYTLWLMALLAVIFILAILRQFISRLRLSALVFAVLVLFVGIFLFADFDRVIADYNVNAYLSGETDTIDVHALGNLSASAAPALLRLYDGSRDMSIRTQAAAELHTLMQKLSRGEESIFSTNLTEQIALSKLKSRWSEFR